MPRVANADLIVVTIRLRRQDVARARKVAKRTATPYQHVIRAWVSQGASKVKV